MAVCASHIKHMHIHENYLITFSFKRNKIHLKCFQGMHPKLQNKQNALTTVAVEIITKSTWSTAQKRTPRRSMREKTVWSVNYRWIYRISAVGWPLTWLSPAPLKKYLELMFDPLTVVILTAQEALYSFKYFDALIVADSRSFDYFWTS